MGLLTLRRWLAVTACFALFAVAICGLAPWFGAESIAPHQAVSEIFSPSAQGRSIQTEILLSVRLPRIALAFLAGAALALVGAVFQALLRNPLADPYTLGVASGGSFGAVTAMFLPTLYPWMEFSWGPFDQVQLFAFLGALAAVAAIYMLARAGGGRVSTMELLLAGVTMGMIFGSLTLGVRYWAKPNMLVKMDRWMMGGLDVTGAHEVWPVLVFLTPAVVALLALARGLDQISFGAAMATGRGVNVARLQKQAFFFGSLATGAVVAVAGPIAFVGLIVPHTVRRLVGADHRLLLPCTFLAGGGFLVLCDTVARTIIAPTEFPVGIITSMLGGPFFIFLLIRSRRGTGVQL